MLRWLVLLLLWCCLGSVSWAQSDLLPPVDPSEFCGSFAGTPHATLPMMGCHHTHEMVCHCAETGCDHEGLSTGCGCSLEQGSAPVVPETTLPKEPVVLSMYFVPPFVNVATHFYPHESYLGSWRSDSPNPPPPRA